MQAAGKKPAVFLYFPSRLASSNVAFLKMAFWEVFYELVYAKVFVFQFANKDIAFLEFGN